jgi:hypothetical protein
MYIHKYLGPTSFHVKFKELNLQSTLTLRLKYGPKMPQTEIIYSTIATRVPLKLFKISRLNKARPGRDANHSPLSSAEVKYE